MVVPPVSEESRTPWRQRRTTVGATDEVTVSVSMVLFITTDGDHRLVLTPFKNIARLKIDIVNSRSPTLEISLVK